MNTALVEIETVLGLEMKIWNVVPDDIKCFIY